GGKAVTLKGRNFGPTNIAQITFAGVAVPAGQIVVIDSFTLTAIPPPAPLLANGQALSGPVDVVLVGQGIASAVLKNGYNYGPTFAEPVISTQLAGTAFVGTILAA